MPRGHAREACRGRGASGEVPACLDSLFANALAQQLIRIVEILEKIGEERVTVRGDGFLNPFEDAAVHALRVIRYLQQVRWDAGDDYRLSHALRSVFPQIARHLATAHRETDQSEIT